MFCIESTATGPPVNYDKLGDKLTDHIAVGTFNKYYVIKIRDIKCIEDVSLLNPNIEWNDKLMISY